MSVLHNQGCEVCRANAPQVSDDELQVLINEIPDWEPKVDHGILKLCRSFNFKDFSTALDFVNQVGEMAEKEGHHPAMMLEWGRVDVTWWTHKIKGLHRNDFICAAKTDQLFS